MTRTACSFSTLVLIVAAGSIGCATTSTGGGGHRDVHASATLDGQGPRMLVEGPARLLHVDVEARGEIALYTAARAQGTDADCAAPAGERVRLQAGGSNRVNMAIGAAEVVCVTAPASRAAILWHAEKADGVGAGSMLALGAVGR